MTSTLRNHVPGRRGLAARVARLERVTEELGENQQGKLAADNKVLTAIGETQGKHSRQLDAIEGKIDNLTRHAGKLDRDLESVRADMAMVKGRLGKVEDKLTIIAKTQAEHTKAITGLESRMTGVEARLTSVETRLDGVETRLTRVEESLGTVNGKLDQIIDRLK